MYENMFGVIRGVIVVFVGAYLKNIIIYHNFFFFFIYVQNNIAIDP